MAFGDPSSLFLHVHNVHDVHFFRFLFFAHLSLISFPIPQFPEQLDRRRSITSVVIVGKAKDHHPALAECPAGVHPLFEVATTVHNGLVPGLCLLLNAFPVAQPSDVGEISRDGVGALQQLQWTGHPRMVD